MLIKLTIFSFPIHNETITIKVCYDWWQFTSTHSQNIIRIVALSPIQLSWIKCGSYAVFLLLLLWDGWKSSSSKSPFSLLAKINQNVDIAFNRLKSQNPQEQINYQKLLLGSNGTTRGGCGYPFYGNHSEQPIVMVAAAWQCFNTLEMNFCGLITLQQYHCQDSWNYLHVYFEKCAFQSLHQFPQQN